MDNAWVYHSEDLIYGDVYPCESCTKDLILEPSVRFGDLYEPEEDRIYRVVFSKRPTLIIYAM